MITLIKSKFRNIPDFPKPGIMFKDITTVIKDKQAFRGTIDFFEEKYSDMKVDYIAGMESRGFIFGAALADRLNCGFVVIRKPGKLPYKTISESYELEYGTDSLEIHEDAVEKNTKVVIIDDLLATGGTALAAYKLIQRLGGDTVGMAFVMELMALEGRKKLPHNIEITSLIQEMD